ncbi:MAG: diphosphokinase / guanosine-3,5-bis(diphosphate) 3-diphosphatase [Solirubrobacteraceae bacterium]|jgi:(p)ppGpp synthase/HD superfamily hydrolase|nr:diphosphokinase / guanosine-3,5-bis(diphosphate) 3-diphosphatase [Solirubrobacteraceae bacterium]
MTTSAYAGARRDEFTRLFARCMSLDDVENIEAAYAFSKGAHRNQLRDDGVTRYFEHCKSVAWIIGSEIGIADDWQIIVIALLHDAREDAFLLSDRRVEINFGPTVRQAVDDLSKRPGEEHAAYLARMTEPHVDWRTMVVKLSDRLQNLRTLGSCTADKQERKRAETLELYLPVVDRYIAGLSADAPHAAALAWLRERIEQECRRQGA